MKYFFVRAFGHANTFLSSRTCSFFSNFHFLQKILPKNVKLQLKVRQKKTSGDYNVSKINNLKISCKTDYGYYISDEAKNIDEEIFFYLPKELFILREDKIKDIIEKKWNFTHSV